MGNRNVMFPHKNGQWIKQLSGSHIHFKDLNTARLPTIIGAMGFIGNRPTASELTTTAGLAFLISAPMVGSKLTTQISPQPRFVQRPIRKLQLPIF